MAKKLWSVNAIAAELDYDRRTVTKRLATVAPDGTVGGHPAWHLDTVLSVLNPRKEAPDVAPDGLIEMVTSRVRDWREIYVDSRTAGEPAGAVSVEAMAKSAGVEPEDVLTWLRAGCPYLTEGDWRTGAGFVLRFSWAAEWASLMLTRVTNANDWQAQKALGLGKGAFAA